MDHFVSRKKRRLSPMSQDGNQDALSVHEEESTDLKLAILASLHPDKKQEDLLDFLLSCNGSVETALSALTTDGRQYVPSSTTRKASTIGMQTALAFGHSGRDRVSTGRKPLTRKGRTLHLYTPTDIADHTPCSIVHNFLPPEVANNLLREILPETESFESITFKLFENVVKSPHTACFYVDNLAELHRQKNDFLYNGSNLDDIRQLLPMMRQVSHLVRATVNEEIAQRIKRYYPDGKKLKYQSPQQWQPNAAFVNCYDGGSQSVGYHTDQLTYLGPRAVIGSLSLGVAREFRVRKIVAKEDNDQGEAADASGQIAIHLPHNSLLVMHAEMQEEWKHSVAPALAIDPHPIAGNKRINITYRWYRPEFQPEYTPRCRCGVPTVLKTVQKQKESRGKYMWMCQTQGRPEAGAGCGFFEWADFTDDGDPIWKHPQSVKSETSPVKPPEV